jgi:hypothetical protein
LTNKCTLTVRHAHLSLRELSNELAVHLSKPTDYGENNDIFSEDELHRDDQTSHTLTHDKHAEIDFTKELERYIIRSLDEAIE